LININATGDANKTTSQLKHWLQTNSGDASLQFVLGNRYAQAEQWSKAQEAYFNAYEISPDNPDYAYNLAISLDQLNQPALAIRYYRVAQQNALNRKAEFDNQRLQQRIEQLQSHQAGSSS
jgi:uncharacterized protein HemY